MRLGHILIHLPFAFTVLAHQVPSDPGVYGPPLELVHVYNDQFPTGITVSTTGRKFSNYPPGLDANNTKYNVAELTSFESETPYPSAEINSPPGGSINYTTIPPSGANYQNYFIGVQSVVIDAINRLWVLDTGRALTRNGTLVPATYGGPKLVGINLSNNTVLKTIVFPPNVAYSVSYLNDVRFDLRPSITATGHGIAYIADSSNEGRNGIVIVDLGTGESWRHLDNTPQIRAERQYVPFVWGEAVYGIASTGRIGFASTGADGIALSSDGETLYWTPLGSGYLYAVSTTRLRDNSPYSEIQAQGSVRSLGQKGTSDGLETDSNGLIYVGHVEQNSIDTFNPKTGLTSVFVRDPRMGWPDALCIASDGYLYFTLNQLWRLPGFAPGTDRRVRPFALFRVQLPKNATRALLL